jgi:amino acid transporter
MTARATKPASDSSLLRAVGVWGLAASIFNVTVGGGIFALPSNKAIAGVLGTSAPLAYVVCAIAFGLIVLCFAEAGSRVSMTGGPYAYVEMAFGPFVGFLSGVMLWLLGTTAVAAVSTVFAANAAKLVPALDSTIGRGALLVVTFATVAFVNVRGVKQGARLISVASIAKLAPLLLLVLVGMFAVKPANLAIQQAPEFGNLMRASIVLVFAFSGVESALVPSGEVRDPARTVPRALFIAMLGVTLLYIAIQLVAQGVLGSALNGSTTPLADAAGVVFGPWGRTLLLLGVVVSTFGYLSGMTLAVPRALFAFARDGFLPRGLAAVHPAFHTPWIAIIVQAALTCVLALTSGFGPLAIISNVAALLLYFASSLAAWRLRQQGIQTGGVPFKVPGAGIVPILSCIVILGLLTSITLPEWAWLVGVLVFATMIFFATRSSRAARARTIATQKAA